MEDANSAIWAGGAYGFGKLEGGQWRRVGADLGYSAVRFAGRLGGARYIAKLVGVA